MAPDLKEGFLTDHNSIPTAKLMSIIRKESELNISCEYDMEPKPFARGKFAQVKRCKHRNSTSSSPSLDNNSCKFEFAAKFIKRRRRSADVTHEILHEIRVLMMASNAKIDRIIHLQEVFEFNHEYVLILEMASGGELQRVLDEEEFLPEEPSIVIMRQVLEAISFLHENNIAHLDIKPQNILLTKPYPDCDNSIKLCDFGISRLITKGSELREIVGTPDYVAPEILHYDPISLATDMWSIGCLTYVLMSGYSPFGSENKQETFCNITQSKLEFPPNLFDGISDAAIDFVKKLLVREPKKRMTCCEALKHDWMSIKRTIQPSNNTCPSPLIESISANLISPNITVEPQSPQPLISSPTPLPSSIPLLPTSDNNSCHPEDQNIQQNNSVNGNQ